MEDNKIILKIGTYHTIVNKNEVPFFNELRNTNKVIVRDDVSYKIYDAPTFEVMAKIDRLLSEDFRNKHDNFVLVENIGKKKLDEVKDEFVKELKILNDTYQGYYHFTLLEQNNRIYVVDEFENFYYGGQDFDNCLEDMTERFQKILNDKDLYLDCEIPARWEIASYKLNELIYKDNIDIYI